MRPDYCALVILLVLFTRQSSAGNLPPYPPTVRQANLIYPPPKQCIFHTVTYNISQTWHPLLLPYGFISCIKCTCEMFNGSARVNCTKKQCDKSKCPRTHIIGGNCCHKCPVTTGPKSPPSANCMYLGKTHKHGTVWETADHKTDGLCTECSCSDGFVSCAMRVCPKPKCSNPRKIPGSCCKQCPGNTSKPSVNNQGCDSLGRLYQDGEQWFPLVASYKHKCIICTCKNWNTHCAKVSCKGYNCDKRCCNKCQVPTTVAPTTCPTTLPPNKQAKYPDCYSGGTRKHNTTWSPTINGQTIPCLVCQCKYSRVHCSKVICPKKYSCSKPVVKQGMCCKQCQGQAPTKIKLLKLKHQGCGSTWTWRVYEYDPSKATSSKPKSKTSNDKELYAQFILEATFNFSVELLTLRANKTHKDVRVKAMQKVVLERWKQLSSPMMKLKEIGIIKDARKRKVEAKARKKCAASCVDSIKSVIKMIRFRSRWCRSPPPPPDDLRKLQSGP